jgi:hypothetical protein
MAGGGCGNGMENAKMGGASEGPGRRLGRVGEAGRAGMLLRGKDHSFLSSGGTRLASRDRKLIVVASIPQTRAPC